MQLLTDEQHKRQAALYAEHGALAMKLFSASKGLSEEDKQRLEAVRQELDELDANILALMEHNYQANRLTRDE